MTFVVVAGALAQAVAWWVVRRHGASIWTTTAPVLAVAGVAAVVVARPAASGDVPVVTAIVVGLGVGVLLYAATFAFVRVVAPRWVGFDVHARRLYRSRRVLSPVAAVVVAAGVVAVGEELFWRGLVREWATEAFGSPAEGAVVTWLAYVLADVPSGNLAILAGALVGGAVWTALALWSNGVVASVVCHACWTSLMVARPVVTATAARP